MGHAREVILLADSSKAGKISFARAGRLEKVQVLITDDGIDRKFAAELRKRGIDIVRA
jgi:DeoR/GlpR family transcriptional regulator of sugar metabolism